jgi:hypothetical protein
MLRRIDYLAGKRKTDPSRRIPISVIGGRNCDADSMQDKKERWARMDVFSSFRRVVVISMMSSPTMFPFPVLSANSSFLFVSWKQWNPTAFRVRWDGTKFRVDWDLHPNLLVVSPKAEGVFRFQLPENQLPLTFSERDIRDPDQPMSFLEKLAAFEQEWKRQVSKPPECCLQTDRTILCSIVDVKHLAFIRWVGSEEEWKKITSTNVRITKYRDDARYVLLMDPRVASSTTIENLEMNLLETDETMVILSFQEGKPIIVRFISK